MFSFTTLAVGPVYSRLRGGGAGGGLYRDKQNTGTLTSRPQPHVSPHTLMGQSSTLDTQTSVLEDFRFDAREERFFCESICFVNSICKILNQFQVEIKYNLLNEAPLFNSEESQFKQNSQTKCEL